jgi:hypothetical protein
MKRLVVPAMLLALLAAGVWLLLARTAPTSPRASKTAAGPTPAPAGTGPARSRTSSASIPRFTPASGSAPTEKRPSASSGPAADNGVPELHRPLIAAIRARKLSAGEKRAAMVKALVDSGPSHAPWARRAPDVFGSWRQAMNDLGARVSLDEPACYRAGCTVEVRFTDLHAYQQASARLRSLAEPAGQHGGRVLTPPEQRPNGEVVGNWIMMAPAGS